jgi:fatty-acyl-CoA synthase
MPLCHSNALFGNFMPMFSVGATVVLRRRFSASRFVDDILAHRITYWSYVGEPVHYILNHVESRFGGDEARIRAGLTRHPDNKLRFTLGNGASAVDIERFVKWFGLTNMYEAYGQTESVIMAFRTADTPRGSVGEMKDPLVKILAEDGSECALASLDEHGVIRNYREAVGELCRVSTDNTLFLGYFDNPEASAKKCRDGIFYSGDLAHIAVHNGKRYLYFDGRTDNWIRKDGENFAAEPIGNVISEYPDITRAVAYGVPNVVASELVMVALAPREGVGFDPVAFFDWCRQRQQAGELGEKWFPDFVRVVADFEHTASNKIQVHRLKQLNFKPRALPRSSVYWRRRGDSRFHLLTEADYAALRELYAEQERAHLLDL